MKKIHLALVVLSIACSTLPATNLQKTYTTRDQTYLMVDRLCRQAGVLGPSRFSPVTGRMLQLALDRIDRNVLEDAQRAEYDRLMKEITAPTTIFSEQYMKFALPLTINLQFNIADYKEFDYSKETFDRRNEVAIPYHLELPALSCYPQLFFGNNVYLESDFTLGNNGHHMFESSFGWLLTYYNGWRFFQTDTVTSFVPEQPLHAGASIGNDYISFIIGRYPHNVGAGRSGNLIIGDNFNYQEISTLSFFSDHFAYNISVTRFDQQMVPDTQGNPSSTATGYDTIFSRQEFTGDQQFRVVHRFDLNLFDKLGIAIDFGTIYHSTYGFDMRFFYPFVLNHNYFNYDNTLEKKYFDEANNILGISVEYAITNGLTISAQYAMDQVKLPHELDSEVPDAFGVLANIKYTARLEKGSLDTWLEGVYTNPFIYLNGKKDSNGAIDYNLDYIVGYHARAMADYGYSGYVYGPDSIVLTLGGEFIPDSRKWKAGIDLLYKIQGRKRLRQRVDGFGKTIIDMSDSVLSPDSSGHTPTGGIENAEHLLQTNLFGSYSLDTGIDLYGMLALGVYWNYDNVKDADTRFKPLATIGIRFQKFQ